MNGMIAILEELQNELRGENSRDKLKEINDNEIDRTAYQALFLEEYMTDQTKQFRLPFVRRGLGTKLSRESNPFPSVPSRQRCTDWLRGEHKMPRAAAHQLCIILGLGELHSKNFFNNYLFTELTRFNEWTEVFYRYCIEKLYDINQAYKLYNRCIEEVRLNDKDAVAARDNQKITIMTSDIEKAFNMETFINEEKFIEYMETQKEKFHNIRNTRRRKILEIIEAIKPHSLLADAFYIDSRDEIEDDEDNDDDEEEYPNFTYPNDEYFRDYIMRIKNRSANFSREFFILCLLAKGINGYWDINNVLTSEHMGFMSLDVRNTFDACVYEACVHSDGSNLSVYYRFYENIQLIKYKRPKTFTSNYY